LIQKEKKGFVKPVNTSIPRFANINNELMHLQKIYSKSNDYNSKKILSRINLMQSFLS